MKIRNKGKRLSGYLEDYVVFDLETTGVNPEQDDIIEISAVKVRGHEIAEEYSTLVNPGRHIPAGATAVNGITDEMVAEAPDIGIAIAGFMEFIGDSVLVGHNIHTFDTNFAYDAALNALGKELCNDYVDTLFMARKCLPEISHHKLTDISDYFKIETKGAHRALNDCVMNQKCYEAMGKLLSAAPKVEGPACPECGGVLIKRKGRYGYFYGCSGFPGCRYTRNIR
ncbi:MAG: exonuclease domain-containing protein [Clostridium sp.]|nr:exonuclease domain-containing protein [Clostridium sp.]